MFQRQNKSQVENKRNTAANQVRNFIEKNSTNAPTQVFGTLSCSLGRGQHRWSNGFVLAFCVCPHRFNIISFRSLEIDASVGIKAADLTV